MPLDRRLSPAAAPWLGGSGRRRHPCDACAMLGASTLQMTTPPPIPPSRPSPRRSATGSRAPSRSPRRPRRRPGRPSPPASTRSSRRPPARARRWPPSSGRSTASSPSRRRRTPERTLRLVYVSPLKALAYDVERNLRAPLRGIGADVARRRPHRRHAAARARGDAAHAADILITTPESLYLMLTSQARELLTGTRVGDRRRDPRRRPDQARRAPRAHARAPRAAGGPRRAAHRPLGHAAAARGGRRASSSGRGATCTIVDAGRAQAARPADPRAGRVHGRARRAARARRRPGRRGHAAQSIWPAIYPELLELVREHRSTTHLRQQPPRGRAPRPAPQRARGARGAATTRAARDRPRPPRLARARGARWSSRSSSRPASCRASSPPRRSSSASTWAPSTWSSRSSRPSRWRAACSASAAPATAWARCRSGRIFPKFRADLLECAVVARRMREGHIEPTVVPRNPLDVLAQQIVAIAAAPGTRAWRSTSCTPWSGAPGPSPTSSGASSRTCSTCSTAATRRQEFAELRPRIVWDRVAGHDPRAQGRPRSSPSTNAGTIPDRGLFSVNLPDGRRVGELDEEMVYEARAGQTFLLGASTWRIEEITRDRVIVTPAPGAPGRRAVLAGRGRRAGPRELGEAIGAFARWAVRPGRRDARARATTSTSAPPRNLLAFLREQQAATRRRAQRPHDRRRALPRRDRRLAAVRAVALRRAASTPPGRWP